MEEDIKELEADHHRKLFFFSLGGDVHVRLGEGGIFGITETSLESKYLYKVKKLEDFVVKRSK